MSGCETIYGNGGIGSRQNARQEAVLRQEMERQQTQREIQEARATAQSAETQIGRMEMRIERLEASTANTTWASQSEVEELRKENQELRNALAAAKAEHAQLKTEIINNVQGLLKEQQKRTSAMTQPVRQQTVSGYEHKVEYGQTLSAIAKAYGVSVSKIKEANKLKSDVIREGQVLFIPD